MSNQPLDSPGYLIKNHHATGVPVSSVQDDIGGSGVLSANCDISLSGWLAERVLHKFGWVFPSSLWVFHR